MNGRYHGVGAQNSTGRLIAFRMQGFEAKEQIGGGESPQDLLNH